MSFLLVIIGLCVSVVANHAEKSKALEMRSHLDVLKDRHMKESDRNMKTWWVQYNNSVEDYKALFPDLICNQTSLLVEKLAITDSLLQMVRVGWQEKGRQLDQIQAILEHTDFFNITGLFDELNDFIIAQYDQIAAENITLTGEEAEVSTLQKELDEYPCACVWGQWGSWTLCTQTCDTGTQNRTRNITMPATNGGANCTGDALEDQACGTDPCPIDCVWTDWTNWSDCDTACGSGHRHRQRTQNPEAMHGGLECTDPTVFNQTFPCNNLLELEEKVSDQMDEIALLKAQLANLTSSNP